MLRKVLAKVEEGRFARGLAGLQAGWQFEVKHRVFVKRGVEVAGYVKYNGKQYGVQIEPGSCFCSCEDAMSRKTLCKHIAFVAMAELAFYAAERSAHRQPQEVRPTS
ncbi:zinc finger SWIM domain-containing protein [Desulfotomaculum nigrificans CO-1-SRB]|uniref:Zinc finger SWIM domain-containing protein n=1 Tax=Desulfotomaculum nigrificans (strain DSM 14880 / VKM B-2319 / CO-1-SRB) TaxID=868595 RepID=F6B888_DESCC|nr:SWIM zinc finger family protein [Desulfotomaculum nigrificans]AEF93533.1 zinc finger SWIM domain-containing protein [Desulfotomaculum nigrificans CO-1-SRB]